MHTPSPDLATLPAVQRQQIERLKRLPELVNSNEALVRRGRFVTLDFQIVVDDLPCFVSVAEGRIERVHVGPQRMKSCAFVVRASAAAWDRFWQPIPEPWSQDLFAMVKKGNASIDGDIHPFMANLQYFKDAIASPRGENVRAAG
jgi:hypothetical protein